MLKDDLLTFTVGKSDGKSLGFWLALTDVRCNVPDPASVAADIGRELHVRCD